MKLLHTKLHEPLVVLSSVVEDLLTSPPAMRPRSPRLGNDRPKHRHWSRTPALELGIHVPTGAMSPLLAQQELRRTC